MDTARSRQCFSSTLLTLARQPEAFDIQLRYIQPFFVLATYRNAALEL
jgi:hypothetical protein